MDGPRWVTEVCFKGWPAICGRPKSREKRQPVTGRAATPQTIALGEMGQAIKQLLDKPAGDS